MFKIHSVAGRVAIGKGIGLILGLIVMLVLPTFGYPGFGMIGFGTLLMLMLMGAFIGLLGMFDQHPVFDFKMTWWMRGTLIGVTFMLMYVLLNFSELESVMKSTLVSWTGLSSPFWILLDGAIIGAFMGFVETKVAGEGENLPLS